MDDGFYAPTYSPLLEGCLQGGVSDCCFLKTNGSVFHSTCSPANRYSPDEESGAAAFIRFI